MAGLNLNVRASFLFRNEEVVLHKEIRKGTYSCVFTAEIKDKTTGVMCKAAAKKVRTSSMQQRETETMRELNHKHIIKFYGVCLRELDDTYILMELAEKKDLRHFLNDYQLGKVAPVRLPAALVWKWVDEAGLALEYLHGLQLSHRDIKSLNFLVKTDYTLKLGDLGLSKQLIHTANTKGGGTCQWMAPEVISQQLRSPKSDVFSYGIVVWELVTTEIPFVHIKGDFKIMQAICNGQRPEIPEDCPAELRDLMQFCWKDDYSQRPTIGDICKELRSCIATKPVFSPQDMVKHEGKNIMGPPAPPGALGTSSEMDLGTGGAIQNQIQDIHMNTQSPHPSWEQIDGQGDRLPSASGLLSSHPVAGPSVRRPVQESFSLQQFQQQQQHSQPQQQHNQSQQQHYQQHQQQQHFQQQQQYQHQQQFQQPPPFGFSPLSSQGQGIHQPSIEDVLSDLYLLDLAKEIGPEFMQLGIYLGFTYQQIERLKMEHHSIADAIFKLLITWRQKQDRRQAASEIIENLSQALGKSERQDLASKIRSIST